MSFDERGYQLTLFPLQPSKADNTNQEIGSVQRESHYIFKNRYEFKGFGASRLVKEFATKG